MFKKILIATDLSQASYALVKCLDGLKPFGTTECLLLQCLSMQQGASIALSYTVAILEKHLQNQREILEKHGFTVDTRIVTGLAKKEINRIAEEDDFSIIVVGAQKHTLVSELFLNDIAYDVILHAKKPVLLIRLVDDPQQGIGCVRSIGCEIGNHILFPTDFSENADTAFEFLIKMAADGAKKITLVHIQDKTRIVPHLENQLEEFNRIDKERLDGLKTVLAQNGNAEVNTVIGFGSPAVEIMNLVKSLGVQLVVMGSQGRGFVNELFLGSVSHNIARHTDASLLLVPTKVKRV